MARLDDYINAKKIAADKLSKKSVDEIAKGSEFKMAGDNKIRAPFLDRVYRVSWPDFGFEDEAYEKQEIPIQEQVLILHYMMGAGDSSVTGNWIAYREMPGASFYFSAFVKRAIEPLKKVFGQNIAELVKASTSMNGTAIETGAAGFEFQVFPKVPLRLIVWEGDNEFPAEANILFDEVIGQILSPEDAAWLAGMLVYRIIRTSSYPPPITD